MNYETDLNYFKIINPNSTVWLI